MCHRGRRWIRSLILLLEGCWSLGVYCLEVIAVLELCMDGPGGNLEKSCPPRMSSQREGNSSMPRACAECDFCHRARFCFWVIWLLDILLTGLGNEYAEHTVCSPFPPACACVCESGSVTSVRTRSWLLWRWRRGRQRRNMTHGMLSGSSESGSRAWPRLWRRARCLRWKPLCVSARSFARFARSSAAHPGAACSPSSFLAEDARLRLLQQCS